jgi:3-hydroxy-9,10-secoandrosta-1,3,5(10)-triene-9,17-dione monooxygenase
LHVDGVASRPTAQAANWAIDRGEAVRRAAALRPALDGRAIEAETLRRLPDATVTDLTSSGLMTLLAPARHGGQEADLDVLVGAAIEVGKSCGSTAWILCIYGIHNWLAGLFNEDLQGEMFDRDGPLLFPGSWSPNGAATRVDGGYRLAGQWPFASGIWHASWVSVAGVVSHDDDRPYPDVRLFQLPRDQVEVIDTWHTSGLRGTGSMDVAVTDVFVPEHRVEHFGPLARGMSPGSAQNSAPIYRMPLFCALPTVAAAPAVGMALGAVEAFRERVSTRMLRYSLQQQSQAASAHRRLGHAAAQAHSAATLLDATVAHITAALHDGRELTIDERVTVRRDCAYVVEVCKQAISEVVEASGASAQFQSSSLQRHLRDVQTLSTHVVYDTDGAYELYGRHALELPLASVMY